MRLPLVNLIPLLPHRIGDLENRVQSNDSERRLPHRIGDLERRRFNGADCRHLPHRIGDLETNQIT